MKDSKKKIELVITVIGLIGVIIAFFTAIISFNSSSEKPAGNVVNINHQSYGDNNVNIAGDGNKIEKVTN
ncbi:MAG: hypothetical protein HOK24_23980, partial [Desulfobacula sp.]|nr:hypothetical protein [Desulfobacula sp.]